MADGGRRGFAAGGEVVLAPTEYEWGIGRVGGNHVLVWDALVFGFFEQKTCLFEIWGKYKLFPLLNFGPTTGRG